MASVNAFNLLEFKILSFGKDLRAFAPNNLNAANNQGKGEKMLSSLTLDWLVVLGFNATLTAKVISWRSMTHMCFLAFSHQY